MLLNFLKTSSKIFILIFPIILAFSQFMPITDSWWSNLGVDPNDFNDLRKILVAFIAINFSILTAIFLYKFDKEKETLENLVKQVRSSLDFKLEGKQISDNDFYRDFQYEKSRAKKSVYVCYFAPYPPDTTKHKDRKQFYKDAISLIKGREVHNVRFKRIVRYTEKNKDWIKKLINDYKDRPYSDLAILKSDLPEENKMPLALSVQIIDAKLTWFVAIKDHERDNEYRDMFIKGEEFGLAMSAYYDRLWGHSDELVSSGVISLKGEEFLSS